MPELLWLYLTALLYYRTSASWGPWLKRWKLSPTTV
jgi:hypothetical protein